MADEVQTAGQIPFENARSLVPFKFLDPYGPEDAALFFGRSFETSELYTRLYSGPVTVVYGESGTGKTSLIQCGLRCRVPSEDVLFVSVRMALDPEMTLRQELQKLIASTEEETDDLDALLRRVIRRSHKTLVLVFDQFEEFFLFQPEDVRQAFGRRLAGWVEAGLNLRLVFAIREEYLARLTELEKDLLGLYENRLWLRRMSRAQAREAIVAPCRVAGIAIETELVTALLDTLGARGQGVELPILQVILDTLYRQTAQQAGSAPELTLQAYQDLGEAHNILARFVDDRLAAYGDAAEIARPVLKAMITPEGTRRLTALPQIAERLTAFGIELTEDRLLHLLRRLVDDRILREDPEQHLFELRHDTLADHIRQWMSGIEQELADVRQTLENRLREFQQRGRLLEADFLADLSPYESRLRLSGDLAELVEGSKHMAKRRQRRLRWVGAGMVTVVLAFGVFSFFQWQEARRHRDTAEANFDIARQAMDALSEMSESDLLHQPRMERLRRQLLEKALQFYQDLWAQRTDDPRLQTELAEAAFRVGQIKHVFGDNERAREVYEKVIQILERLAREHPERSAYQDNQNKLAVTYKNLGNLQWSTGRISEAQGAYHQALKIWGQLASEHPDELAYMDGLARIHNNLGVLHRDAGQGAEAQDAYQKAIKIWEGFARDHPEVPDYVDGLARSYGNLGEVRKSAGDSTEAQDAYQQARKIRERLVREHPNVPDYQNTLASSFNQLGALRKSAGQSAEAQDAYQKAHEIWERLAREHSDVPDYQSSLASSFDQLGALRKSAGHSTEAQDAYQNAYEIWERLAREHPEVPVYQDNLASAYNNLGRIAEARDAYEKAVATWERLAREDPDGTTHGSSLAGSLGNLAWTELFLGHPRAAITAAQRGLERDPSQVWIRTNLVHGYLLDNQYTKALAIYNEYKDQKMSSGKTFGETVLEDFKELRAKGIEHLDMAKIEGLLRKGGSSSP